MTMVGISTHYRDFLMMAHDGVRPPIYNADMSQILSAPAFQILKESRGEVDITYKMGIFFVYIQQIQRAQKYTNLQIWLYQKKHLFIAILQTRNSIDMLTLQHLHSSPRNYGRIHPLRWGYYSNPQMCMFMFTVLLTITLSLVMIFLVFIGLYHKIIGSLLCLYVVYRFVSLGLSSPGLAVEAIDQRLWGEIRENNSIRVNAIDIEGQIEQSQHQSPQQQELATNHHYPTQASLKQMGFYSFCNQCKVPIQHRTRHCKTCNTCIDGYDHHCIWIGKCIGKKNMWQFKEFLCFVFVTLIYALILSIQSSKIQRIA